MGKMIELTASDGHKLAAYRADPAGKPRGAHRRHPGDLRRQQPHQAVTDGFAADGYLAIAPAMFDRVQKNFDVGYTPDGHRQGPRDARQGHERHGDEGRRGGDQGRGQSAGKVGIVGYCWGGLVTWLAAGEARGPRPRRCPTTAAASSTTPTSQPKVPLMGHFGEKDAQIPVDGVKKLAEKHTKHQIFIYAADHGFNCDQRGSFNAPSAKQARERTLEFFRKHVG